MSVPVTNSIFMDDRPSALTLCIFLTPSSPFSFFSMGMVMEVSMSEGETPL